GVSRGQERSKLRSGCNGSPPGPQKPYKELKNPGLGIYGKLPLNRPGGWTLDRGGWTLDPGDGESWGPREHRGIVNSSKICDSGTRDGSHGSHRSRGSGVKNAGSDPTFYARRGPG
ncbi:MAG: hypothetical protein VXW26_10900, partial [SAR324 cluster bacterium]|nr:hypothetical protein [SAR324 cluster bacterium]